MSAHSQRRREEGTETLLRHRCDCTAGSLLCMFHCPASFWCRTGGFRCSSHKLLWCGFRLCADGHDCLLRCLLQLTARCGAAGRSGVPSGGEGMIPSPVAWCLLPAACCLLRVACACCLCFLRVPRCHVTCSKFPCCLWLCMFHRACSGFSVVCWRCLQRLLCVLDVWMAMALSFAIDSSQ